ncbi:MAG: putative peptidoglycan glycosyltransferase FtsW [Roseovarius sp.]|nr:putative peptidoglycan glycosyltransferase FtsW [Roseovarius sp.]MCY4207925.1 putative peptidoglycan glycosyltransferase FtsW [Roseovarius sp.]MCY4314768.1 putative peptidoglycan glycosyltransferase FtsW [Roseovarius sp.]
MTEMIFGTVPERDVEPILPKWWRTIDKLTILFVLLLFCIGLLLSNAASLPLAVKNGHEPFYYFQRHVVFGTMAIAIMLITSMMNPRYIRRIAVLGFLLAFAALLLLPFLGTDFGKGAVRWYSLGFVSLQPSEFLKPLLIVFTAWLMAASQEINGPPGMKWSFIVTIAVVLLLALQPDFGQSALVVCAWGVMYFIAGAEIIVLFALVFLVMAAGVYFYKTSEHLSRRIDGYLSGDHAPNSQLGFAENAIREGGLLGVGPGEGELKWNLPDAHSDFIIAVAAEEYGLFLVMLIIFLYLLIMSRSMHRLMRDRDPFIRLAGTGLVTMFSVQAIINIGVAARLLPAKGMTLPMVSYGGSSMLAIGFALGMIIAFTRTKVQGEIRDVLRGNM